jgi:hypothetical protein
LADRGHAVHVAFEITREKLNESALVTRLTSRSTRITCGTTPERVESVRTFLARSDRTATRGGDFSPRASRHERRAEAWESLATLIRLQEDYLRFFAPEFSRAVKLRERAEKRLPHAAAALVRAAARAGGRGRRVAEATLRAVERTIPPPRAIEDFVREQAPDVLLVTPLIELGSQQVDYVKCAQRLGVRTALCVASWDNLTSKGLVRVIPDHVIVWNDAQKREAVSLHGVPPDRVVVTGAQLFDGWFDARPSRSREEFCRMVGLDPSRPFVLYVGSSIFIAPEEVPFAERWLARLRRDADPLLASTGVLVRPHPANSRQWRTLDANRFGGVAVWPPIGSDPNGPDVRRDYFDSLYYSAAVVGINTSAQIEAGIIGRPVFTVRAPEFEHSQAGTLHFEHLVNAETALVREAATLDEHARHLRDVLHGTSDAGDANRRFIRAFIRPFGDNVPAVPAFASAVADLAAAPHPAAKLEPWWVGVGRVPALALAHAAHVISEDRPLWVYVVRPFVTTSVWMWAGAYHAAAAGRRAARETKPWRRRTRQFWHESSQRFGQRRRRANKALSRAVRTAGSAARRVLKGA